MTRLTSTQHVQADLIATIGHELRDPMTSCIGFAEMLIQKGDQMTPAERDEALRTIARTGRRLVHLIEDILEVARIEGGALTYVMRPVAVAPLVQEVLEEQRLVLAGFDVQTDVESELAVEGDDQRLRQVLVNLLSNAAKFSPEKGRVGISARRDGDEVVLSVSDEGIGIDTEDIARVFERFVRITQPGDIPGTGLGLYITRSIVEAHRGRIWVESEPGRGSTFFVALPAAPRAPE